MARRRFFVEAVRNERAEVSGDTAEHLRRVLRVEAGQRFEIADNQSVYLAEVEGFRKDRVLFHVLERLEAEAPPVRVILLASLIKFDRFEWIVEKATELGAETIVPVEAERSEKGLAKAAAKRVERWRRIALESSQQSRRSRLPEIESSVSFQRALETAAACRYFLDEERGAPPLASVLPSEEKAGALRSGVPAGGTRRRLDWRRAQRGRRAGMDTRHPGPPDSSRGDRRPGRAGGDCERLDYPTASTAALTGAEPTGIVVNKGAPRVRLRMTAASRMTAMLPERRFRISAY